MNQQFIRNIPKAELHVHIEGTFEPELIFKIAKRNNIKLKYPNVAALRSAYHFTGLQSFLDLYYENMQVLQKEEDFYDLMLAYLKKAKQQNIRHAEIFFDPQAHLRRGVAFATVIKGLQRGIQTGKKKFGISAKLIMCFLRDLTEADAIKTFQQALPFKKWIVAIGLDSAEKGNPPSKFKKVYAMARAAGFLEVAHAGEVGPAKYIWEALNILKVERIDHGVHCMGDPKLIKRLVKDKIALTVCPLSNIKLHVFKTMKDHPLKRMLELKLLATINSDDPAYCGGYLNDNIVAVHKALGINEADVYQLEKNAFNSSFISASMKKKYLAELDNFYKKYRA